MKKFYTKYILILFTMSLLSISHANDSLEVKKAKEEAVIAEENLKKANAELKLKIKKEETKMIEENIDKFGFGLGFGTMNLGQANITNAVIDNGVVRITGEEEKKLGFWLTTSWIHDSWPTHQIGFGPFFGVQLGDNNAIINSIAFGVDFSFKRLGSKLPLDFQIGYGVTKIDVLADGYTENSAPPGNATQVLTKEVTETGLVFIFSYKL